MISDSPLAPLLTDANYQKGFLIDDDLMAGVSEDPAQPGQFFAFVLRHETGEYLGYQPFSELKEALSAINQIPRSWIYESSSACGGGKCGKGGCGTDGSCPGVCSTGNC